MKLLYQIAQLAVNTKIDQLNDQITERTHNDLQKP